MKYVPKINEWFHAFLTNPVAMNGKKCASKTRCGPYKCTQHVLINTNYVQTVLAENVDGTDFKFLCKLFRFEEN